MAKETFSFEEAAAPAKVFSFEEALGEPAAANAPATEPEVVTSARPWQGAGAGRGGLNDPRRLDVERAPESFERPGFAEGFTKGLTESERPLGPGGVLLRAADALTGGYAQERFNKANQSVLDDKTDPALAGEFAKPAAPKPKTPVLQPRTDTISPTGGVVDALAGVPVNTARSLGSTVLNFGALAAELGLTIQSPEQFRAGAAKLDKAKARTGLSVSDEPLARTGTALDALIPSAKTLADYAPEGIKQLGMMAVMGTGAIIADAGARGVNQAREEGLGIVPSVLYGAGQAASEGVPEAFSAKFAIEAAKRIPLAQALRGDARAVTTAFQQTAQSMGVELGSEQVSALGNWVVDKIAADPTATPDRLVADMKEAVKATIVQGPTMLAGAKLMQAATTGLAQRPEDQAARELARELERGTLPPGTVETLNPNLSQPAITPKTLAGLTEIGAAASVDEAIIAAARATTPQAQAVDNIGRLLGDSANVSQPGNIPPVDSGAAGAGAPEPGIRVEAGVGASGAAGPALDTRGVRDQPAGGIAPLATGRGAELTPDIAETTRQIQDLEGAATTGARSNAAIAQPKTAIAKPGGEPASVWFGRRGDGYQTPEDAQSALPTRTRISPELDWRVEQMPTGRYRLAGYDTETRAPTFTVRMNPTGTATVLGNPKAIAAKLAEAGITKVLPNRDGVTVATSQAQAAAQFLGGGEAAARTDTAPAAIKPVAQPANPPTQAQAGLPAEGAGVSRPAPAAAPEQVGPYGRDLTPIAQGGKPFKTKAQADAFRKANTNNMRTVKQGTGFVLRELTSKELAAREKAAKRIAQPRAGQAGVPISAHAFIVGKGGLARGAMADSGFDRNMKVGNRWLFAGTGKPGLTLAEAAELLAEAGYIREESEAAAAEIIKRSIRTPQYTAEGWERIAEAEQATRFEDHLAAQQEAATDEDPFGPAPAFTPAEIVVVPKSAREEYAALIDAIEAAGLDVDAILEEAARITENLTQEQYSEYVRQALTNAIANSRREADRGESAVQGRKDAERGGTESRSEDAGGSRGEGVSDGAPESGIRDTRQGDRAGNAQASDNRGNPNDRGAENRSTTGVQAQASTPEGLTAPTKQDVLATQAERERIDREERIGKPALRERIAAGKAPLLTFNTSAGTYAASASNAIREGDAKAYEVQLSPTEKERKAIRRAESDMDLADTPEERATAREQLQAAIRPAIDRALAEQQSLTAPTEADVLAQQDRREQADDLDQREQIQREASGFQLQAQAPEQRRDNTGDMFGGPTAEDVARARKPGKQQEDDGTAPLFSRGRIDDATRAENLKRWSNNAPYVSSAAADTYDFKTGQKVMVEAYHGTARPDRVGTVFQRKRATSGPMAFFTSAPELASSYAQGKQDTSLSLEDQDYSNWFKVKFDGDRSATDLVRSWYRLDPATKDKIAALAPRVTFSDEQEADGGNKIVLGDESVTSGTGSYDYNLDATRTSYDRRGNPLKALVEDWLNSANLFNDEERFMQVLKLAGFPVNKVTFDSPKGSFPFVYKAYIAMQKPLVTDDVPQDVIEALKDAAKRDRSRAQVGGADMWDKNTRTLREWVANYTDPANDSASYVWTSIPDKVTEVLKSMGYDGIIDWSGKGGGDRHPVYIPFEETQVKSATGNKGTFDPMKKDIRFSRAQPFYSALSKSIEGMTPKALTGAMWKDGIKGLINKGAVKEDEVEWSGIREWLDLQTGKVSKEDVLAYLDANGVQVQEVVLGGSKPEQEDMLTADDIRVEPEGDQGRWFIEAPTGSVTARAGTEEEAIAFGVRYFNSQIAERNRNAARDADNTKYGQYTLPGGQNYREVLLTLPTPADDRMPAAKRIGDAMARLREEAAPGVDYMRTPEYQALQKQMRALNDAPDPRANAYQSSHWGGTLNVIAHIRLNDRTDAEGNRVLFVEEIQSDWGQEGKRKGFKVKDIDAERARLYAEGRDREAATVSIDNADKTPLAPFVTSTDKWLTLALKRVITMAAQEGYDRVAFVNGEQSAERYDLSKSVDSIKWRPNGRGGGRTVNIEIPSRGNAELLVNENGKVVGSRGAGNALESAEGKQLDEVIGKEITSKIMQDADGYLSGNGLKIGGEGMRRFYDFIVPTAANKLLAKLGGGKVETVRVNQTDGFAGNERKAPAKGISSDQIGFTITPAMREKASAGLPLFRKGADQTTGLTPAQFTQALAEAFGAKVADRLQAKGVVVPLADQTKLPAHVVPFLRDGDIVFGFYDPRTNRTYAVLENLTPDMVKGLVMHEVGVHYGFEAMLGGDKYKQVMKQLDLMRKSGNVAVQKAHAEAVANAARPSQVPEETLAYLVQNNPENSVIKDVIARIKAWLFREFGIGGKYLTADDLTALARAAVQHAARTEPGGVEVPAFMRAYHGTPHAFDKFSTDKIGTGEGAQAFGWGLYFAGKKEVAQHYRSALVQRDPQRLTLDGKRVDPNSMLGRAIEDMAKIGKDAVLQKLDDNIKFNATYAPAIAEGYRAVRKQIEGLSPERVNVKDGNLYEVEIPEEGEYLLWDKPLSEQPEKVRKAILNGGRFGDGLRMAIGNVLKKESYTGQDIYKSLERQLGSDRNASDRMFNLGIKGIKYLDGTSRADGDGTYNYVIFSADDVEIQNQPAFSRPPQTETKAFKDWFGDSKVVDAEGKPLVVYHGTSADFSAFDKAKIERKAAGEGFYFTSDPAQRGYAEGDGANVMPVYLAIKNPTSSAYEFRTDQSYDGLIFPLTSTPGVTHYAVREPEQIKSATGNRGTFDPKDPDIRFSRTNTAQEPEWWQEPGESKLDKLIYEIQDGRIDLKRVQEAIKATGKDIAERFDARMAETLYPGRVARRTDVFLNTEVRPLLQAMALSKIGMDELGDYLIARHAPERNAQVAKVNPDLPDGGAGRNSQGELMTDDAAAAYLAALSPEKAKQLAALAKRVDSITAGTRELLVGEGLEKPETVKAWTSAYKNYVPLFKDEAEHGHPIGTGFNVGGSASKRSTGSTKEVTNVLAHVLMQREAVITRAEKNRVGLALYGLALSHPNKNFWTVVKPGMSNTEIAAELQAMGVDPMMLGESMDAAPTIRTVDTATNQVVDRPNPMYKKMDGAITLKVAGEDRVLLFNEKDERALRLATNLKNMDGATAIDWSTGVLHEYVSKSIPKWVGVAPATRWLASVNTQYNPVFGLVNVTRDVMGGVVNLTNTPLRKRKMQVLGDVLPALKGISRDLRGGARNEWSDLFNQFQDDGGQTGFKEMFRTADDRARAIEKELQAAEGKLTVGKATHAVLDLLDDFNTALENAVRLSAYKAGLDEGMSRPAAAKLARELTVDFNRKGRTGRELGPLYAFLNASIQGTARTVQTLAGPAGAKIVAGGLAIGGLQALMLAFAGFDEDEPPEWVKTRGLIIPIGGDKRYIVIPLALGLHVIPNTGRVLTELALYGGNDAFDRMGRAIGEIAGAFNPLGGGNIFTMDGALRTVMPTVIDPFIELGFNKNFAGSEIEKRPFNEEGDNRPGFQRARESTLRSTTGQAYLGISKAINTLTGGNDFEAGAASPTPERIRYLAQTVGGGLLREMEKAVNATTKAGQGDDIASREIPMAGRFVGQIDPDMAERARYFESSNKIKKYASSLTAAEKAGADEIAGKISKKYPEVELANTLRSAQERIRKLNKNAAETINDRDELARIDRDRFDEMKALNAEIKAMERLTRGPTLAEKIRGEDGR